MNLSIYALLRFDDDQNNMINVRARDDTSLDKVGQTLCISSVRRKLMKKALITGITGRDGSYLARIMAEAGLKELKEMRG